MTGLECFQKVLEHLASVNSSWNKALSDQGITEVPDGGRMEIGGAIMRWGGVGEVLFTKGYTPSGYSFHPLFRSPLSAALPCRIELKSGTTVAWLYPDCLGWSSDELVREFLITQLAFVLPNDRVDTDFLLDEAIVPQAFLAVCSQSYLDDCLYHAATLGYSGPTPSTLPWHNQGLTGNAVSLNLRRPLDRVLCMWYQEALLTPNPYYQFLAYYHVAEYQFYKALFRHITDLGSSNVQELYVQLRKGKVPLQEEEMLKFVFSKLAGGFGGVLDFTAVEGIAQGILEHFDCDKLNSQSRESWATFLYKVRCGIVHSKEGEAALDRTPANEQLLRDCLLPFMKDLCEHLIENS